MAKSKWRKLHELKTDVIRPWDRESLFRCDPYLVWTDVTTTADAALTLDIAVLVELAAADDFAGLFQCLNPDGTDVPENIRFLPNGFELLGQTRFITALVDQRGLAALVTEVLERRIERFSLQDSRKDVEAASLIAFETAKSVPREEAPRRDAPGSGTYLGIIDDGLPVLRVREAIQFLDHVAHFWDQGWQPRHLAGTQPGTPDPNDPYWQSGWEWLYFVGGDGLIFPDRPRGFLYGRRLKPLDPAGTGEPNDRDEYFLSRYFSQPPRQTHGAGVLGLLAPWISGAKGEVKWPEHISGLAMVQLPSATVLDTSGGSLAMRVIDGLRYILWQESRDAAGHATDRPIVTNVSYGIHAGPHDGTSMFERAITEMLDDHPRLHLVLPAGNAARVGSHARRALAASGEAGDSATITLQVLPDNGRDTFVEFWVPRGAKVELRIRPPGSDKAYKIREGQAKIHFEPDPKDADTPRRVHFGAVYAKEVAQGTNGPMALLAIAPTRHVHPSASAGPRGLNQQPRSEVLGMPGLWELTVHNLKPDAVTVDAWVERDDAAPDVPSGSRQAYFPDSCCDTVRMHNATPEGTLNGIATFKHDRLHVVGAMRADGVLSNYSAAGRGRPPAARPGPDVVAPADWSGAVPGLLTTGFVQGAIARLNGTSAACAVYARALAKQLGTDPTQPPSASEPEPVPPEITCVPESQPEADPCLRGQDKRQLFPFDVDL